MVLNRTVSWYLMTFFILLLLAGSIGLVSASTNTLKNPPTILEGPVSIAGKWLFSPGDDAHWATPNLDDSNWQSTHVPGIWEDPGYPLLQQMAWYRLAIDPKQLSRFEQQDLGIQIGAVRSAYEIYINGQLVGGVGKLPPASEINYDQLRVYRISPDLISANNKLVVALRVWGGSDLGVRKSGGGAYSQPFLIGNYTDLVRSLDAEQTPKLISSVLFFLIGLYFLYLYARNRVLDSFLWFGCTSVIAAIYVVTQTQWKYELDLPFIVYEKIESGSFLLFLALFLQSVWTIVDKPINGFVRGYQMAFVVGAGIIIVTPGIQIHHHLRDYWQIGMIPGFLLTNWVVVQQARYNRGEARTLLVGIILFGLCGLNDLLANMQIIQSPSLVPFGYLAILVSMSISLANRFTALLNSLEQQVSDQTLELKIANRNLRELSRKDPLTGLLNRRGFLDEAEYELKRLVRNNSSLSIVLADIDLFKTVNDSYGHAFGDEVLIRTADLLKQNLREVDRIGRWGGEEFIVILPDTDENGAYNISEKLRLEVEKMGIITNDIAVNITITFGVANYKTDESLEHCIARADDALYHGKETGRNRVIRNSSSWKKKVY